MFGLEVELEITKQEQSCDFLDHLKNPQERRKTLQRLEKKIQKMKNILTRGVSQKSFLKIKTLLEGYLVLQRLFKEIQ